MHFKTIALSAAIVFVHIAPASSAEHVWQTGDGFVVKSDGLNLSTKDGRAALLARAEGAAFRLCRDAGPRVAIRRCQDKALSAARQSMPARLLGSIELALREREATRFASR